MPSSTMNLQRNMDTNLAENLLMHGVVHCMPFLAKWTSREGILINKQRNNSSKFTYFFACFMQFALTRELIFLESNCALYIFLGHKKSRHSTSYLSSLGCLLKVGFLRHFGDCRRDISFLEKQR